MTITSLQETGNVGARGNGVDRQLGDSWELKFIAIAELFGWKCKHTARLIGPTFEHNGRRFIAPDVTIQKGSRRYACEVKHKNPTQSGRYGLEVYRADGLADFEQHYRDKTGRVTSIYVIHDWTDNGTGESSANDIHHWKVQFISVLQNHIFGPYDGPTYYNGQLVEKPINYYSVGMFDPLLKFLE